ncbi:TonB-dependent receptor domain-containing protein [Alteromonas sp. S015]|uniref:TonB-dependent receptor domain-containing protein n=1 Tax=Alteromonas sp. S015 TaxID=3117401 RepID=UPI002FDFBE09
MKIIKKAHVRARSTSIIFLTTCLSSTIASAFATEQSGKVKDEVERYLITGSRIKHVELESPSPTIVISADDLTAQGFNTVYEALQSFAGATGSNRGQALEGSARNAETINLRGLGPNRTLFLLNGKRVANYPRVFDGDYNVFNIASIPTAAVERIEIVTGASSSVYGSDAMAGVVNIITKRNVETTTLTARLSRSGHDDAANKRFALVTGNTATSSGWTLAIEYENQDMLRGKQRDWLDDRFDTPADLASQNEFRTQLPRALSVFHLPVGADDFTALDPMRERCDQFGDLTYTNISFLGNYCGRDNTGDGALIHDRENLSVYFTGTYELSNTNSLSMDMLYWHSDAHRVDSKSWSSDFLKEEILAGPNALGDGMFLTSDGTTYMVMRDFQSEELLMGRGQQERFEESMLNLSLSLSGELFDNYDYEIYASHSFTNNSQSSYQLKSEKASDYFVDHNQQTDELTLDLNRWWQPLSETGFNTIFGLDRSTSDASVTTAGLTLAGELNRISERPANIATFVEYESSEYDLNEHPRTLGKEGQGWVGKTGTAGNGKRNRYALGAEFSIPLANKLTLSASARYDRYIDNTAVDGAPTYKLGLQWRPIDSLLFRGSHGTVFRAPDLHNVFKGASGSFNFVGDYALIDSCAALTQGRLDDILIGTSNLDALAQTCDAQFDFTGFYGVLNESSGNQDLKEETGYSNTLGVVWSFYKDSFLSFDFFRIKLEDLVTPDSVMNLNLTEYQCLSGQLDRSSSACAYALSRTHRNGELGFNSYKINKVQTSFVNTAMQETTGFDMALIAKVELDNVGLVKVKSNYTHLLETRLQGAPDEEVDDNYRDNYYNANFRSKINTVIELIKDKWTVSLAHTRYGSLWNDVRSGDYTQLDRRRYAPLNLYNLGISYQVQQRHNLRVGVVNLFDSRARFDASQQQYPYFRAEAYPQTTIFIGRHFSLSYQAEI